MAIREGDAFRSLHFLPGELLVTLRPGRRQLTPEAANDQLRDTLNDYLDGSGIQLNSGEFVYAERRARAVRFATGRTTTEVHAYRFDDSGYPDRITGASRVPEVIETLSKQLRQTRGRIDAVGSVDAISPNWLAAPAQGWGTGGGPGLPPEPIGLSSPLPATDFTFADQQFGAALAEGKVDEECRVVVAVLDTSPTRKDAEAAAHHFAAVAGNTFLKDVVDHTTFHEWPLPDAVLPEFAHLVPFWANRTDKWQPTSDPANRETYYNIVDHGLFVAGVVRSIAPGAEIHLYRVLDRVGVGNLAALVAALGEVGAAFLDGETRLIVNLSLLIEEFAGKHPFGRRSQRQLYAPLFAAIDALRARGALIVAAAGNDSLDLATGQALGTRRDPRLPARLDQVISVAAVDEHGQPATFSNKADSNAVPNGIAIFGGNATVDATTQEPEIEDPDGAGGQPPIGIVGAYSRAELPCDKGPNETGLVYWAGTSFAAPVISGIAARRCAQVGAPSAPDALIAEFTAPFAAALGCKVLKAAQ